MKKIMLLLATCLFGNLILTAQPVVVHIENKQLEVVVSSYGAELQSIKSAKSSTEYLWQGDDEHWKGKAPVMFPVNVKFKDAHYTYKGVDYEMPDMGLAKISYFELTDIQEEEVTFQLKSNKSTLKKYPFPFLLTVRYTLSGKKLISEFIVENTGSETMYYALGGHPGFRFPIKGKNKRNQNGFVFAKNYTLDRTEIAGGLVQDNQISFLQNESGFTFSDTRIPNAGMFVENMPSRKIGICVPGEPAYITVNLGDFPNVNMWTPPGMPFACIEPMVGHHDFQDTPTEIDKKTYLVALPAGKKKSYRFSIMVHE